MTNEEISIKELNLCELLADHVGEIFFSLDDGDTQLIEVNQDVVIVESSCQNILRTDGKWNNKGVCILWPSRALYEQYPLDPYTAWMKWQEK